MFAGKKTKPGPLTILEMSEKSKHRLLIEDDNKVHCIFTCHLFQTCAGSKQGKNGAALRKIPTGEWTPLWLRWNGN